MGPGAEGGTRAGRGEAAVGMGGEVAGRKSRAAPMAGAMWASARVALIGRKDWRTGEAEGVEGGAYANVDPCFLLE